jgi:hypothetical protein
MNEQSFIDADFEVINMVNRGRGAGGELPSVKLAFIPSDRADRVLALDQRIQILQKHTPAIAGAMILLSFVLGLLL